MQYLISAKEFVLSRPWTVGGVVLGILFFGYLFFGGGEAYGATLTVKKGDFAKEVRASGTVIAAQDVNLGFAMSGRISSVNVKVGSYVYSGQVLAQIENGDLVAQVSERQADLDELLDGTRPEEIAIAEADVVSDRTALVNAIRSAYTSADDAVRNKADAAFTNSRTNPDLSVTVPNAMLEKKVEQDRAAVETVLVSWEGSLSTLSTENAVAAAQTSSANLAKISAFLSDLNAALNQAVADGNTSAATISSYASSVSTGRTNVNASASAVASASAALSDSEKNLALSLAGSIVPDVSGARAALDSARAALAKTRVVAPFSGIVTRMDAKVGEIVSPSDAKISMQSSGIFQIETFIPEVAIADVVPGHTATTTLDAYGAADVFAAKVIAVDPAETVKDGVPTYKTTLSFLAPDPRIRSGMTADVFITTGILRDAIVIPAGAVGSESGMRYVSVVVGEGIEKRSVETGPSPSIGQVEIRAGLSAGEVILLSPAK